jgi:type VI secretion system secreted protein Hcp
VFSFSWGVSNSGNAAIGGGQGVGKSVAQDFHFVCATQKSSPLLFQSCGNGDHVPKATFIARKAGKGQQEYLTITLSDVLISSYQIGGSNAGEIMPTDQISCNCAKDRDGIQGAEKGRHARRIDQEVLRLPREQIRLDAGVGIVSGI